MFNFDYITEQNIIQISRKFVTYRILIVECYGSGQTIALPDLITINQILIKFIYMQKIHMKQNSNVN